VLKIDTATSVQVFLTF